MNRIWDGKKTCIHVGKLGITVRSDKEDDCELDENVTDVGRMRGSRKVRRIIEWMEMKQTLRF